MFVRLIKYSEGRNSIKIGKFANKILDDKYSYLDTFTRYDSKKGILHNDEDRDLGGYILRSTSGEYRVSISQRKVFFNRIINFFKTN